MVYSPRPMEIRMTFEDRSYKLGETIDLTVEVDPAREVRVRSGTLALILEERLSEAKMGRQMGVGGASALQGGAPIRTTDYVPMQQTLSVKSKTSVHSSTEFLGEATLTPEGPNAYRTSLRIEPTLPSRLNEANEREKDAKSSISFHWTLVVRLDVVRGRNSKKERPITVAIE